jgi:homopolymeric O-antigen transport system ATP-binding protein
VSDAPIAILARNLSKVYRIYRNPVHALTETITGKKRHTRRVALDNVNLEVRRGEIVGVLGRNGAGKSTLLKIIAGTLERSEGDLDVRGRVTAILELGSGFHPEYTGRENIYMGGMCLGMSKKEVDAKLDSIIDFSEQREVIDLPFKTYSTGMQARLTFSVAISVDPDILIVDEALSVGDARFQQKCFSRLQRLRARSATVLLVTHDTNTITTLCDRAMILENGRVFAEGDAKSVASAYLKLLFGSDKSENELLLPNIQTKPAILNKDLQNPVSSSPQEKSPAFRTTEQVSTSVVSEDAMSNNGDLWSGLPMESGQRYGSGEVKLLQWGMVDEKGQRCKLIESGRSCKLYMVLQCEQAVDDISCGFAVKDRRGTVLWGITNIAQGQQAYKAHAGEKLTITASCVMWLAAGDYFVNLGAGRLSDARMLDFIEDAIQFRVTGPGGIFTTAVVNLQSTFAIESE